MATEQIAGQIGGVELACWQRAGAPVAVDGPEAGDGGGERHAIHSYFNMSPESPAGDAVVMFTSSDPQGHVGAVTILPRGGGKAVDVATDVPVEDAHRQAYQQWSGGGRWIVYQREWGDRRSIHRVDVRTGEDTTLLEGRQLGWGEPAAQVVPVHGPHWAPGEYRDIEFLNIATGELRPGVSARQIWDEVGPWVAAMGGDASLSLFFGVLSPDQRRLICKGSIVRTGEYRGSKASFRFGMIGYDLIERRVLFCRDKWGHPSWHADSRHLITPQNVVIDSNDGSERRVDQLQEFPGSHPSIHPGGKVMTSDFYMRGEGIPRGWWAVGVGDLTTGQVHTVHEVRELPGGATSWRPPHPHPAFSRDGRRLYFNVSQGKWTRLHVVEARE